MSPSMATSTFLFDNDVRLVARTGEKTPGGLNMSSFVQPIEIKESSGWSMQSFLAQLAAASDGESDEDDYSEPEGALVGWVREGLVRVTVDKPTRLPDILTVSLHLPATPAEIDRQLQGVTVVAANRHFMVLNTGPKLHDFASSGHYLVYKFSFDERLSLLPPIDWNEYREDFGRVPVIMAGAGAGGASSDFLLALVLFSRYTQKHSLFVFTAGNQNQWIRKEVSLPKEITEYPFRTDVAFPLHSSFACWADLNLGIMICDLYARAPRLLFVPLPKAYQVRSLPMARGRPNVHSTAGFINGHLKLVYMDGYDDEDCPRDKVTISTWTYKGNFLGKPDEREWVRDHGGTPLRVTDFWVDVSRAIPGLPKRPPIMCPVLCPSDRNMVYFFCSDIDYVDGHIATRGEHVLLLNMESKKVQSWRKCPPGRSFQLIPSLLGVELSVDDARFSDLDDQANSHN